MNEHDTKADEAFALSSSFSLKKHEEEITTTKDVVINTNIKDVEDEGEEEKTEKNSNRSLHSEMKSFKKKVHFDQKEDVYAFITTAPVCSAAFLLACCVISVKYIVYSTLISGISFEDVDSMAKKNTMIKFFLIPIAVSMQADLMAVYEKIANYRYNKEVLTISAHATKLKFNLSYALRFVDGVLSLTVNFLTMLSTKGILNIFLNFAALHFLQDIDDVIYNLVEKGFFGDTVEHMSVICKQIVWPRRTGKYNAKFCGCIRISHLDTVLYMMTMSVCYLMWIVQTIEMNTDDKLFQHLFQRLTKSAEAQEDNIGSNETRQDDNE